MLAYMKIKYFQLLKAYLQIGNKNDFVQRLIAEHLGPIQLYGEILYYMKELINNLVYSDYDKYNHLLNVNHIGSFKKTLNQLYMFEDDFRTSVEISVIFQICIIIATLEDTYKITMLRDHFEKEQTVEKDDYLFFLDIDDDKASSSKINKIEKNINEINNNLNEINNDLNEFRANEPNVDKNIINFHLNNNKNENAEIVFNTNMKESNINFINPNQTINSLENINKIYDKNSIIEYNQDNTPYNNIKKNYQKNKFRKIQEEKLSKQEIKMAKKLGEENLNLESKFSIAVYRFFDSLVSRVEIRMNDEKNSKKDEEKTVHFNSVTNQITKKIINLKNDDIILSNINYNDIEGNNLDNNIDNEPNIEENLEGEYNNDNEE
jgi:hypothetical protein